MSTQLVKLNPLNPEQDKIRKAASLLREGKLVAFPTETVYGLGANFEDKDAILRLYEVKERPKDKPFTIHIAEENQVYKFAKDISQSAFKLMVKFWPGPLTLVLRSSEDGLVGLRMPKNRIALSLLKEAGVPVVAPSANLSGAAPAQMPDDVLRDFNDKIDMVLDGGRAELGRESTVVESTGAHPRLLRQGAIGFEAIQKTVNSRFLLLVCTGNSCRSVMAKGLLNKQIGNSEVGDLEIISAGVAAKEDSPATDQVIELMEKEGIDVSSHKSHPLTDEMIKAADFIFAMEGRHSNGILSRVPEAEGKVYLLRSFAKQSGEELDIIDPIGKSMEVYKQSLKSIKECLDGVIRFLKG